MKKNLIIGLIAGYDFEVLRPFVTTLKRTAFNGDVVFFYADTSEQTLSKLQQQGVTLIPFNRTYPYIDNPLAARNSWAHEPAIQSLGVYCVRYLLAHCYLAEHGDQYTNVLLTDTRDVVFQNDPFNFEIGNALCCFMEREGVTIGESPVNAEWIREGFGPAALECLAGKPIVCSGVTVGPTAQVKEYLRIVLDSIVSEHVPAEKRGMDQGIHNYLLHTDKIPFARLYRNTNGPVLTLGIEDSVRIDDAGRVHNAAGTVPNIVHQYDRHWSLAKRYWSRKFIWRIRQQHLRGKIASYLARVPALRQLLISLRNSFQT